MSRKVRDKTKPLLFEDKAWHSQHSVVVVVGQPVNQWVVLKGYLQQAKSN